MLHRLHSENPIKIDLEKTYFSGGNNTICYLMIPYLMLLHETVDMQN